MKILLTGANGYIGKRLLPVLVGKGHRVICCVRDRNRFNLPEELRDNVEVLQLDFLDETSLSRIPNDVDAAYYLIHSMSTSDDFEELELECARNFRKAVSGLKHVIYLSGIVNEKSLSKHLASRKAVEDELAKGSYELTTLRAGIIIGSGSASFEILRDLVEKLPVMVAPKWINTRCQPIGIQEVMEFLEKTLLNPETYGKSFDIGGRDVLTYQQMLLGYAKVRGLQRWIFTVPVMTPKLSSYWLYFITSTSYKLASALVSSMKVEVICRNDDLNRILKISPVFYEETLASTLSKIDRNEIVSGWRDSLISGRFVENISEFIRIPSHGCLTDRRSKRVKDRAETIERIWRIGGKTGWYYTDWLWQLRGFIDKVFGGVGLRRGRTHPEKLSPGDAVDFWRVLYANKDDGRLLLFAEMKLPGEAWLEFEMVDQNLHQTATFRPKGIFGRAYWYSVYPLHGLVFQGLIDELSK
jgi:uncharacterized protein YbjT (DUF2867 family)